MVNHERTLLSKRTKWQDPATKTYVAGLFVLQETRIRWEATLAGASAPVVVLLSAITTTQRAKGKPFLRLMPMAAVFEFESEADRDMVVEALETTKQMTGDPMIAGLTKAERGGMLKEDPDCRELHTALVGGGAVSEEEFWVGLIQRRGALMERAAADGGGGNKAQRIGGGGRQQARGLSNAMKNVQHEVDGRHNTMTLNITKEMIAQIFAEKPHVLRSHQRHVPHDMTDNEFWSRYARHELAKEARRKRLLSGGVTDDLTDEHADMFDDRLTGAEKKRVRHRVRQVDPTVNLAANLDDGLSSGFGIAHNASKETELPGGARGMADDLTRDINRHGEVVLQGVAALQQQQRQQDRPDGAKGKKGPAGLEEAVHEHQHHLRHPPAHHQVAGLDDLCDAPVAPVEVLNIQDPSRYFDRMQQAPDGGGASTSGRGGDDDARGGLWRAVERVRRLNPHGLTNPPMDPALAFKVLADCSRGAQTGHDLDSYGQPTRPPDEVLDAAILAMIRAKVLAINEILRHFWGTLPGNTPPRVQKLDRLKGAMDSKGDEIESLQRASHGAARVYMRQLLRPARDALEAALTRFDEDLAARRRAH